MRVLDCCDCLDCLVLLNCWMIDVWLLGCCELRLNELLVWPDLMGLVWPDLMGLEIWDGADTLCRLGFLLELMLTTCGGW